MASLILDIFTLPGLPHFGVLALPRPSLVVIVFPGLPKSGSFLSLASLIYGFLFSLEVFALHGLPQLVVIVLPGLPQLWSLLALTIFIFGPLLSQFFLKISTAFLISKIFLICRFCSPSPCSSRGPISSWSLSFVGHCFPWSSSLEGPCYIWPSFFMVPFCPLISSSE